MAETPDRRTDTLQRAQAALKAGRLGEGYAALGEILKVDPADRNALYNMGVIDGRRGDRTRAALRFRLTVLTDPAHVSALGSLASLPEHLPGGVVANRLTSWARMLAPGNPTVWRRHAEAMAESDRGDDGPQSIVSRSWRRAVLLGISDSLTLAAAARPLRTSFPGSARAMLVSALHAPNANRQTPAVHAACWSHLAELEQSRGQPARAVQAHRRCACLDPARADVLANLAAAHQDASEPLETDRVLSRAVAADPSDRHVRWLLGCRAMARHRFEAASPLLATRWTDPEPGSRAAREIQPLWTGNRLGSRSIHLWPDFNIGDEILYASVVPDVTGTGVRPKRRVVLEADPRLRALFSRSFPHAEVIDAPTNRDQLVETPPETDVQASTALAACWLRQRIPQFPDTTGYLKADPDRVAAMGGALSQHGEARLIGLGWTSGNRRTAAGKATRLIDWAPLLAAPGIRVVSLQYDPPEDEIEEVLAAGLPAPLSPPLEDLRDDIDGLAALIAAMDAVVSISGLTAHLAGALGMNGHVLLPPAPLWFWFDQGRRTPWYPSLQLYRRAPSEDGWQRPISEIASALQVN